MKAINRHAQQEPIVVTTFTSPETETHPRLLIHKILTSACGTSGSLRKPIVFFIYFLKDV